MRAANFRIFKVEQNTVRWMHRRYTCLVWILKIRRIDRVKYRLVRTVLCVIQASFLTKSCRRNGFVAYGYVGVEIFWLLEAYSLLDIYILVRLSSFLFVFYESCRIEMSSSSQKVGPGCLNGMGVKWCYMLFSSLHLPLLLAANTAAL
jgi:hypothetical protein